MWTAMTISTNSIIYGFARDVLLWAIAYSRLYREGRYARLGLTGRVVTCTTF
jgi:hypothetical protein